MKFTIDTNEIARCGLDLPPSDVMLLAALAAGQQLDAEEPFHGLDRRGLIIRDVDRLTGRTIVKLSVDGANLLTQALACSEVVQRDKAGRDRFFLLAEKLRELWPKGDRPGTRISWRGSNLEVASKLKSLVKRGLTFTDEEVLEAAKRYVDSFGDDNEYMQVLKYFISKVKNEDGVAVLESRLMSMIENPDDNGGEAAWTANLR